MSVAFVLRKFTRSIGLAQFDAEDVIDHSSPYKGTAERSSATKKPHIENGETHRICFGGFQPFIGLFKILLEFELFFECGFCSAQIQPSTLSF